MTLNPSSDGDTDITRDPVHTSWPRMSRTFDSSRDYFIRVVFHCVLCMLFSESKTLTATLCLLSRNQKKN
jgi:hypothetical protein